MKRTKEKLLTAIAYHDLINLGRMIFTHLMDKESWSIIPKPKEKNYLSLATALMTKMSSFADSKQGCTAGRNKWIKRSYQALHFKNLDNKATKQVRWSTVIWCENDCHNQPMWYGHKIKMYRVEYSKTWNNNNTTKDNKSNKNNPSSEFKIIICAMKSSEDSLTTIIVPSLACLIRSSTALIQNHCLR